MASHDLEQHGRPVTKLVVASARPDSFREISRRMRAGGYNVELAESGAQTWRALLREPASAIVLDASCASADLNPLALCSELGTAMDVPLIVLTRPGRNRDRVRAFHAGANQCLTSPVSAIELEACLWRSLSQRQPTAAVDQYSPLIDYRDLFLMTDFRNNQVKRASMVIPLTVRESALLCCLVKNAGTTVPKHELLTAIWTTETVQRRPVELKGYISHLRKKIEPDPAHPTYLLSRRGLGYIFVPQETTNVGTQEAAQKVL